MEYPAKRIDQYAVTFATDQARARIEHYAKLAVLMLTDPDKQARLAKPECVACHHSASRVAGQAMTSRPCGICNKPMMFPSTCTDVICSGCARDSDLCRHCGADLKLRPRRKYDESTRKLRSLD